MHMTDGEDHGESYQWETSDPEQDSTSTTQSRIVLLQEPQQRWLISFSTDIYSSQIPRTISLPMRIGRLGHIQKLDIYTTWTWQMREEALFTISSTPRRKVLLNPSPRRQHRLPFLVMLIKPTSLPSPKLSLAPALPLSMQKGSRDTNRVLHHKCEYVVRLSYKL